MAPRLYSEMTEREAILRRALDRIVNGANPAWRPGYPDYMNKAEIVATAERAIRDYDATFEQVPA